MGFSPHTGRLAWVGRAFAPRVRGISPTSVGINKVWRLYGAFEQIGKATAFTNLLGLDAGAAYFKSSTIKLIPKQIKNNQILKPFVVFLAVILVFGQFSIAFAGPPLLPAAFYGNVTADDQAVFTSTMIVVAAIDGVEYARANVLTNEGDWVYTLKIPADNPSTEAVDGGRTGDTVTFSINNEILGEAPWQGGSNTQVDLKVSAGQESIPDETAAFPAWLPWLLIIIAALALLAILWFLFVRPRLRKT